ncbi:hypothetical protein SK128_004438 [Halocaridina rubra]|uniref:Exonuclease domain-containing protein n=1 Tax=Halocaridina rubra TaxID=373956 RepID=A0AAN8WVH3_HALRR
MDKGNCNISLVSEQNNLSQAFIPEKSSDDHVLKPEKKRARKTKEDSCQETGEAAPQSKKERARKIKEESCPETGEVAPESKKTKEEFYTETEKTPLSIPGIPSPILKPELKQVEDAGLQYVIFDIETTGFRMPRHITQLAAVTSTRTFSQYVIPDVDIEEKVTEITGISFDREKKQMYHKNQPVEAIPIHQALEKFLQILKYKSQVLVGHNIRKFDSSVLFSALEACGLYEKFHCIVGILDTLELVKKIHPQLHNYQQENIYKIFFADEYNAHDALEDVTALQRIFDYVKKSHTDEIKKHTFSTQSVHDIWKYNKQMRQNLKSYRLPISNEAISKHMAKIAAGSGLTYNHIKTAHSLHGKDGIEQVFSELTNAGKPRVTKNKRVIEKLFNFMERVRKKKFLQYPNMTLTPPSTWHQLEFI